MYKKTRCQLVANLISICFPVVFAVLFCQMMQDKVFGNESGTEAESVNQSDRIKISVRRGPILDRNGKILADSKRVTSLFVGPTVVNNKNEVAAKLADILRVDPTRLLDLISDKNGYVRIKKALTKMEVDEINRLKLNGVYTTYEYNRFYPCKELLSHVIGMVDVNGNGIGGIEKAYEKYMKFENEYLELGEGGLRSQISDINSSDIQSHNGFGIKLTIDKVIQQYVEEEIEYTYNGSEPLSIMAIVMKVSTGEILAMANRPTFDPNNFGRFPAAFRRNRCITDFFEPGSIMKPLIVGALFNNGLISPEDEIDCHNGTYKIGSRVLRDVHPYDKLTVADVVIRSSNIGMVQLTAMIEKWKLYTYLTDLQFGDKFSLKLPGQSGGKLRPFSNWTSDNVMSLAMGYEITVTPLQLVNAFCCIANGGDLLQPTIVKTMVTNDGEEIVEEYNVPNVIRQVMTLSDTRDLLNPILVDAVNKGTGRMARLNEYQVAGKTGTARKLGGYIDSRKKIVASFVGYAPAENPEICVLVMVDEPKGTYYGGSIVAPVVSNIIKRALDYHHGLAPES